MYSKFKSPDIVTGIEVRRFEWLWNVVRMDSGCQYRGYWKANREKEKKRKS
jgi:hypothetical protein